MKSQITKDALKKIIRQTIGTLELPAEMLEQVLGCSELQSNDSYQNVCHTEFRTCVTGMVCH